MITNQKELKKFKKRTNFFETPDIIAKKMAELADISRDELVLEPSAGKGKLLQEAQKTIKEDWNVTFHYCETEQDLSSDISQQFVQVGTDFLQYKPGSIYDTIIMNPPYRDNSALGHVNHAWNCLKPGGNIIALVDKKTAQKIVNDEFYGFVFEYLEFKKAFSETNITTVLVIINKPLYEK